MNKKLIFFDIDGTLLTETKDHCVPESTTKALELLRKNGHVCIINTGRPYAALDDVIKSIEVDGYVCGCGTYVSLGTKILLANHIEKDMCYKIVQELDRCKLEWMLEGEKSLYYSNKPYSTFIGNEALDLDSKIPGNVHCITEKDYSKIQFDKFIMALTEESDYEDFYNLFKNELTFINRNGFYELVPKKFSKATGMQFLEEYLQIPHENTIAVGDSSNDIPMLEYAETGILMGGADTKLYKYATFVTSKITEDGIFNAFKKLKLI